METNHRSHRRLLMTAFSLSTEKSAPLLYLGSRLEQKLITRNSRILHNDGQKSICIFSPFICEYRLLLPHLANLAAALTLVNVRPLGHFAEII